MMGRKAVLHIFTTYNNVLMTATDLTGCLLYTSDAADD